MSAVELMPSEDKPTVLCMVAYWTDVKTLGLVSAVPLLRSGRPPGRTIAWID